jgi:hypothetical protein
MKKEYSPCTDMERYPKQLLKISLRVLVWWFIPVILALGRLRQEDGELRSA